MPIHPTILVSPFWSSTWVPRDVSELACGSWFVPFSTFFLWHCRMEVFHATFRSPWALSACLGFPLHLILLFWACTTHCSHLILLLFTHQSQCVFLLPPQPISPLDSVFPFFTLLAPILTVHNGCLNVFCPQSQRLIGVWNYHHVHGGMPDLQSRGGGGATPWVLGRQLPLLPPPPLGAFAQQVVDKGVALRRPWAPKAPDVP